MPKVKICGNTTLEDAKMAVRYGADYLGFIFTDSKRRIDPAAAQEIISAMKPEFRNFVAVFYNQPKQQVERVVRDLDIKTLQFHGDETALYCRYFMEAGYDVVKTFRIKDAMSLKRIDEYDVSAFLFDTYSREEKGGTGMPFDWNLIEDHPYVHDKLFLAGGLNIDNLEEAIKKIRPYAVDVASGVETEPGRKSPELLKKFIHIAKEGQKEHAQESTVR